MQTWLQSFFKCNGPSGEGLLEGLFFKNYYLLIQLSRCLSSLNKMTWNDLLSMWTIKVKLCGVRQKQRCSRNAACVDDTRVRRSRSTMHTRCWGTCRKCVQGVRLHLQHVGHFTFCYVVKVRYFQWDPPEVETLWEWCEKWCGWCRHLALSVCCLPWLSSTLCTTSSRPTM